MKEITYAQAINEAIREEMLRDDSVIFLGEDIGLYGGAFGVSKGLIEQFGDTRIKDTPISEAGITGCGVGAAMTGLRPIVEIQFSDFCTIAMDQIVNQAAKARYQFGGQFKIPLVIRMPSGSGTGAAEQHSQSFEAIFAHIPGLRVVIPSTPEDVKGMLKTAIRDDNPVIFFEQKLLYRTKGEVPDGDYTIPFGKAKICKHGTDVTIITYGRMLQMSLSAAAEAEKSGISVEVLDLRSINPLDKDAIFESVKKTSRLMIVHEACLTGGFGAELSAIVSESETFFYLDAPIMRICGKDTPIPYNPTLEKAVVPNENEILDAIKKILK